MSSLPVPATIRPMQADDLPTVFAIEQQVQPFPWREQHFHDSLSAGHACWVMSLDNRQGGVISPMPSMPPEDACATPAQYPVTGRVNDVSPPGSAAQAILGYAILLPVVDEIELLTIAVAPAWQRRGVGRRLLHGLMARAREDGMQAMFLEVASGNPPALQLYRQAGFVTIAQRRQYYRAANGRTDDAWVMRCPLQQTDERGGHD